MKKCLFFVVALLALLSVCCLAYAESCIVAGFNPNGYSYLYDKPTSSKGKNLGRYNNGESIEVLDWYADDRYAYVMTYDNKTGYMGKSGLISSDLTVYDQCYVYSTNPKGYCYLYDVPTSVDSRNLGRYDNGDMIYVLDWNADDKYAKVFTYDQKTGYINKASLTLERAGGRNGAPGNGGGDKPIVKRPVDDEQNETGVIPGFQEHPFFVRNVKLPVYSGPGEYYYRGANGKAYCSTSDHVYVGGWEGDWLWVTYNVDAGGMRVGYVNANSLPEAVDAPELMFADKDAKVTANCSITDDPFGLQRPLTKLKSGSYVVYLGEYEGWAYISIGHTDIGSVRGFIPASFIELQ